MNEPTDQDVEAMLESLIIKEFDATSLISGDSQNVTVIDARGHEDWFDYHSMMGLASTFQSTLIAYVLNSEREDFWVEVYDQDELATRENYYFGLFAIFTYLRGADELADSTLNLETEHDFGIVNVRLEAELVWIKEPKEWHKGNSSELWLSGSAEEVPW